jgi:hypothetical protein
VLGEFMRAFDEFRVRAFEREGLAASVHRPLATPTSQLVVAGRLLWRWLGPVAGTNLFLFLFCLKDNGYLPAVVVDRRVALRVASRALSRRRRCRRLDGPRDGSEVAQSRSAMQSLPRKHGAGARPPTALRLAKAVRSKGSLAALGVGSRLRPAAPRLGRCRGTERAFTQQAELAGSDGDFPLLHFVEASDWLRAKVPHASAVDRA